MTGFAKTPSLQPEDERVLARFNDVFIGEHD